MAKALVPVCTEAVYLSGIENPMHREFVRSYIETGSETVAFTKAGYIAKSDEDRKRRIRQLMLSDAVRTAIDTACGFDSELLSTLVTVPRTVAEISRIAFADPRAMFDENGHALPLHDLDPAIAAAVSSYKIKRVKGEDGEPDEILEVKFWDKLGALERISKYLGMADSKKPTGASDDPVYIMIQNMQGSTLGPNVIDVTPNLVAETDTKESTEDDFSWDDVEPDDA